jgi:hypothetical protein
MRMLLKLTFLIGSQNDGIINNVGKHIGLIARLLYHIQALEDDFGFFSPKPPRTLQNVSISALFLT